MKLCSTILIFYCTVIIVIYIVICFLHCHVIALRVWSDEMQVEKGKTWCNLRSTSETLNDYSGIVTIDFVGKLL